MTESHEHDTDLDDLDRALLNALQWDFPVDPTPYATLAERLGTDRGRRARPHHAGEGARRAPPALGDLRHPRARLRIVARRRPGRPRPHRRRRRGDQPAPRRQPQLQAQPPVQPLVHARGAAGRVARRPPRRAAPRLGRARHPQAPHAAAVQDRREARHDGRPPPPTPSPRCSSTSDRSVGPTWRPRPCRPRRSRPSAPCRRTCRSRPRPFADAGRGRSASPRTSCSGSSRRSRSAS